MTTNPLPPPHYAPPPPPPTKSGGSKKMLYGLLSCGAVFLLIVIIGAASSGGSKKDPIAVEAPVTTTAQGSAPTGLPPTTPAPPTTQAPGSKANPAPIGTPISPAKDWTVTVVSAEVDATPRLFGVNQFNKPDPGTQYVAVTVNVLNGSKRPNSIGSNVKLGLLGTSGVKIDTSFAVVNDHAELKTHAQLQPGASLTGELVFEVPTGDIAATMLLAEPTMTLDEVKDQRYLAIQ